MEIKVISTALIEKLVKMKAITNGEQFGTDFKDMAFQSFSIDLEYQNCSKEIENAKTVAEIEKILKKYINKKTNVIGTEK